MTGTQAMKLPKSNRMTARQVDDISYIRRIAKKQERRSSQQENKNIQVVHQETPKRENLLTEAVTIKEIDAAYDARKGVRDILQVFESFSVRQKELHTQQLRTARARTKLCAKERSYVRQHALEEHKKAALA
ncbi:hypothetical protein BGZ54_003022 [Gamsiella multidivaricata]|nr:hypothetical protein BGZ54_003022 [Gamsiella multidivaricata]